MGQVAVETSSGEVLVIPLSSRQSKLARLTHEHRELKEKLKEERRQTEELWTTKTHLEDERRLQDRTVEQLQRKVSVGCRDGRRLN